jgi:response regulator RpfG family c-di-GMP phosphodiesterase
MKFNRIDRPASTVLLVDRDPLTLTAMASVLHMQGHRGVLARTEEVAMQAILNEPIDVIVLAIEDLDAGCQFAHRLRSQERNQDVPIIFLVPKLTAEWTQPLHAHGGVYSLLQPIDPHDLIELVERAIWLPHVANLKIGKPNLLSGQTDDWVKL